MYFKVRKGLPFPSKYDLNPLTIAEGSVAVLYQRACKLWAARNL